MAKGAVWRRKQARRQAPLDSAPLAVTVRGIFSPGPGGGRPGRRPDLRRRSLSPGRLPGLCPGVRMNAAPLSDTIQLEVQVSYHASVKKSRHLTGGLGKNEKKSQLWDMKKVKVPVATVSPDTLVSSTWMTERW